MKTFTYKGKTVRLEANSYKSNGALALVMQSIDGEELDVITVNLSHGLQSDSMVLLDTNNYPNVDKWIEINKIGISMCSVIRSGFCEYPLYIIFTDKLK